MKNIKGYFKKPEKEQPDLLGDIVSVHKLVEELGDVKNATEQTLKEAQDVIRETNETIKEKASAMDDKISSFEQTAISLIEDIKSIPHFKGEPGKDADEVDQEKMAKEILAKIEVPKIDEKAIVKKVIAMIPESKADLKIIKETFEVDPMTVVDKILSLPPKEFQLSTDHIKDLDSTLKRIQTNSKGYVHGGGFNNIYSSSTLVSNGLTGLNFTGSGVSSVSKDNGTGIITVDITGGGGGGTVDSVVAGTGISVNSTDPANPIVTNSAPDQTVSITDSGIAVVTGTYPNFNVDVPATDLSGYVPYTGATGDVTLGTHALTVHNIKPDASDGLLLESNNGTDIGLLGAGNTANVTWYGSHNFDTATQDTIAAFTGVGKTLGSLATATYPSLTELSYVKGVTSAIQTQLNAKGVGDMVLASSQSVTGLKTFDTTKLAVKGSSTGATAIASANAGASNYTATLQAATGTIAYTSDITGTNSGVNTGDQTITNSSDATSHTVTLSASGGSVQFIEGSNITLTTGGTAGAGTVTIASTGGGTIDGSGTTNELTYWVDSNTVGALAVATYPSLTELSYVKGVTSSIQTQLNAKGAGTVTAVSVATANGVSGSSSGGATPALTIALGAITPTTVNALTLASAADGFTVAGGTASRTLAVNGANITMTGSGTATHTFPSTTSTLARTDAGQTFTGVQNFTSPDITTSITTPSASFTAFAGATTLLTIGGTGASASLFAPSTLDTTSSTTGAIRTSGGISAAKALNIGTNATIAGAIINTNNAITAVANAATVPVTASMNTVTNNSAATLTITMATAGAVDRQKCIVNILDFSAAAQTITWVNTENSTVTAPTTSNGSTTLPLTVAFIYNNATSKWRCVGTC